jgi:hypothetical protein
MESAISFARSIQGRLTIGPQVGNLPHKIGGIVRQNGAYYPITAVSFSLFINSRSMHA